MMAVDWFVALLAATVVVRGLGAGLIYDVALVGLPARRRIGATSYATFARANFEVNGLKTYGPISIVGLLLTITIAGWAFARADSPAVTWTLSFALFATVLAFLGTFRALPAIMSVRRAPDDPSVLSPLLDQFARWHTFSAVWQVIAFVALVVALALAPGSGIG